jgi:hypothetical protein
MKSEIIALIVAVTISMISITIGVVYYNIQRDAAMKSNIESAIVKGIDPIAVKCAYGSSDPVCVVYAANRK